MQEEMDSMFDSFFGIGPRRSGFRRQLLGSPQQRDLEVSDYRQPLADMWETDKEFRATVEMPGVNKEDIKINAADDGLEIKVEKKSEHKQEDKKKGMYRFERSYSGFYRYFSLPENADAEHVEATYKNGVLELKVPKKEIEAKKRRLIDVK